MSEPTGASTAGNATVKASQTSASNAPNASEPPAAPTKAAPKGNPAFRMMGLPRLRLPSRNWLIFLSITGSIASAIFYDKYQTRRVREKWCNAVSHIAEERLDSHQMPRRLTIYLAAPPGDGLRSAREHFHNYVKPILVAAAMDWDVVEGRKEGDVRYKTAERVRKIRRKAGEGTLSDEEQEGLTVEAIREKNGTHDFEGIGGDIIVGRHTWKEYVRGLHEGWLGPASTPVQLDVDEPSESNSSNTPDLPSVDNGSSKVDEGSSNNDTTDSASTTAPAADSSTDGSPTTKKEDEKKVDEKPKPRQPPPYILPEEYPTAYASSQMPELIGPSVGIRFPHVLGFRNTPIRIYRFLNRRHLADSVGRNVAAAVLASHRSYNAPANEGTLDGGSASADGETEVTNVLKHEERDWWKTTYDPRKEHEESVWIEDIVLDERVSGRFRAFELSAEDEDRAKKLSEGSKEANTEGRES